MFYDTKPPIIAQVDDGKFMILGMYTMYLSFAFPFLLVVGLVSGAVFYALPFYPPSLSLRHLSYTSLYF